MKRILLLMLLAVFLIPWIGNAQIQVGSGTTTDERLPIEPYYGYSYSQVIYLASEINASGTITELKWYFNGSSLSNSNDWTIYIGHTTKTEFSSTSDWVAVGDMTQVYSGTFTDPGAAGWITFDITDWAYNGTDNIVVAVDENASGYNSGSNDFYCTSVTDNRGLEYHNDATNPDPASPPTGNLKAYIANIIFGGISQACPTPTDQVETNVSSSSADLGWTENGSATTWNIEYGPKGFTQGSGTTISVTSNPYTLNVLSSATSYDWYVQADCGGGSTSNWCGPSNFTTSCNATTAPLSENFDGVSTPNLPSCWLNIVNSTSSYSSVATYSYSSPHSSPNHIRLYNSSDNSAELLLISPQFSDLTSQANQIRFWAKSSSNGYDLIVGTISDPSDGTTFTTFSTITLTDTYTEYTVMFGSGYTGTDEFIAFKHGLGGTYRNLYIDDFVYEPLPSCPSPADQAEANITASSVNLSWTSGGSSNWNIEYGPAGFTKGTGTVIPVTTNPYQLTGLSANTSYDWYVQDSCGVGDVSTWTGPSTFTTACSSVAIPWSEGFETMSSVGAGIIPDCMAEDGDWTTMNSPGSHERKARTGTNYIYTKYTADDWLFSPPVDLVAGTSYDFSFWYVTDGLSGWTTVEAMYGNGQTSANMTNPIGTPVSSPTNTTYAEYRGTFTPATSGTYYLSIHVEANGTPWYISFDDLLLEETPACPTPVGMTASDQTTTSAKLTWENATGISDYNWQVVPMGNGEGNGVVANGSVSDTTVIVNGLNPATNYDFYVQSVCSGSSTSSWSSPYTFTTACPAKITSFPYLIDFENGGSAPNCWENDPNDAGGEWKFVTSNSHGPSGDHSSGAGYYALLDDYLTSTSRSPFNLLTPIFDLSANNTWYKVSYWAWIGPDGASNPIYFQISLDGGNTWKTLYTHDHLTTGTWFKVEIDLNFNKSDAVQFRFKANSIYDFGTDNSGIDDFTIEETQAPPVPLSDWAVYTGVFFILGFLIIGYRRRLA